jgi:FkbM family methyltransferase
MRDFARDIARRLPLVRDLLDRPKATCAEPGVAPAERFTLPAEHRPIATEQDIFYCFRLLLDRCPNPEEWPGHSSRAGQDLENVVASYVTSREFALRGLLNKSYNDTIELAHFPDFSLFLSRDDLAVGYQIRRDGRYEPAVCAVLRRHVKPGMTVLDIGANIGYLTMLLAKLVTSSGRVVAIEPNPENVKLLEASRRLNGFDQIAVIQIAAGRQTVLLALNVSHSNGMTAELPGAPEAILASRTVPCFALDAILPRDRPINLVKIDVEGAELYALMGLEETIIRDRPVIVSELSPGMMPGISHCSGAEYLRHLIARGYRIAVITDDGSEVMFDDDADGVMDVQARSGVDHIDILATPM